jgi:hypothetical protein
MVNHNCHLQSVHLRSWSLPIWHYHWTFSITSLEDCKWHYVQHNISANTKEELDVHISFLFAGSAKPNGVLAAVHCSKICTFTSVKVRKCSVAKCRSWQVHSQRIKYYSDKYYSEKHSFLKCTNSLSRLQVQSWQVNYSHRIKYWSDTSCNTLFSLWIDEI